MRYAEVITGHTLEEYRKKYNYYSYDLATFTQKEVDDFDKENISYKHKGKKYELIERRLLLKGKKWWLIDGVYYEIPRPFRMSWISNIHKKDFKTTGKKVVNYKGFGLLVICSLQLILIAIFARSLFNYHAFSTMLNDNAIYSLLAIGMTFVLLTGGIDISVGSTLAVSAVATTKLMTMAPNIHPILWVFVAIAIGAFCGLINGFLIGKLKVVPLIATLGTMYAFRGLAFLITGGSWYTKGQYTEQFLAISQSKVLGITSMTIIVFVILVLAGIFLHLTKPGRRLYAVGTSESSSQIAGINVDKVKILAYVLCGALAGLAGILFSSDQAAVNSEVGSGFEMTAVAICVIGGVANTGGKGRIDCLALGIFFMALLTSFLSLLPGFSTWQDALKGGIIIVAILINFSSDTMKKRRDVIEMGKRL